MIRRAIFEGKEARTHVPFWGQVQGKTRGVEWQRGPGNRVWKVGIVAGARLIRCTRTASPLDVEH